MKTLFILFFSLAALNLYAQQRDQFKKSSSIAVTIIDEEQEKLFRKMAEDLTVQIDDDKSNLKLVEQRAKLFLVLKEYDKAIVDYDRLIQMDSANAAYYYFRGLNKLSMNDQFQACEDFKKAKELNYDYNAAELMLICQ